MNLKKNLFLLLMCLVSNTIFSQENIDDLLAAGIEDAKRFSTDYLFPATEGVAYGINNGWFNHGKAMDQFGFEFSIQANAGFIADEKKSFDLRVAEYNNVRFPDNSPSRSVATALGHNDPDVTVIVTYDDPIFGEEEIELTLPTGIGATDLNLVPTAFAQLSFAPFSGTELKVRYFPEINYDDAKLGLYGIGIQQEFTRWLPVEKLWPVAVSGVLAYTHLNSSYNFTDSSVVEGENQRVETDINSILAEVVVSTRLKVINFYAAMGYLSAKSNSDLLGTFRVSNGILFSEEIVDPFSVEEKYTGIRTTVGAKLQLGFFGLHADYTLAEFNSANVGLGFSF